MGIFYSSNKELRSGWRIVRTFLFVTICTLFLAILSSLLKSDLLGEYTVEFAIIIGVTITLLLDRKPLGYIGLTLKKIRFWKDLLIGLAWGGMSIGLIAGAMLLLTREITLNQIRLGFGLANFGPLLFYWLIVSIAEESLFRGYILSTLKGHLDNRVILIISASIFAAIHLINPDYYWFAFIYAFLIGLLFAWITFGRGNLGCVIGFHFAWNILQEKGLLNMPDRGGEVWYAIVLVINFGLAYWLLSLKSRTAN